MTRLIEAWRRHPWLVGSFVGATGVMIFFAARMVVFAIYWSDPAHMDQAVEGWMTPGYVAHSWDIPRDDMVELFGAAGRPGAGMTLDQIAAEQGITLEELTAQIEGVIVDLRLGQ